MSCTYVKLLPRTDNKQTQRHYNIIHSTVDNINISLVQFGSSSMRSRQNIMLNDLKNIFIKNFTGLKVLFAVMTAYLLYDEISLFVSKPTLTSISRAHLGPEHFPEIRVCPVPSFLQSELQSQGDTARLCSYLSLHWSRAT